MSTLLRRFHGSERALDAAIVARLNDTRPAIKVHAEIQLLCFYECHRVSNPPRLIATSKASCYLCDLFLKIHGAFQVISTFGKLNERWILPDWLADVDPERICHLCRVVELFDSVLNTKFREVFEKINRKPDPIESVIALSAAWHDSDISVVTSHDYTPRATIDAMHPVPDSAVQTLANRLSSGQLTSQPPDLPCLESLVELTGTELPYMCCISPDLRQLRITVGFLTLLFDFSSTLSGYLSISQEQHATPDVTTVEAMAIPTASGTKVRCPVGSSNAKIQIRHGRTFVNLQFTWNRQDAMLASE